MITRFDAKSACIENMNDNFCQEKRETDKLLQSGQKLETIRQRLSQSQLLSNPFYDPEVEQVLEKMKVTNRNIHLKY